MNEHRLAIDHEKDYINKLSEQRVLEYKKRGGCAPREYCRNYSTRKEKARRTGHAGLSQKSKKRNEKNKSPFWFLADNGLQHDHEEARGDRGNRVGTGLPAADVDGLRAKGDGASALGGGGGTSAA